MSSNVSDLLQDIEEKEANAYKEVEVHKDIELNYDLGHLLASDTNPLNLKELRSNTNSFLQKLTRDNCQLVVNKLYALQSKVIDGFQVAQLPAPITLLPRSKPVPKPKPPTKWELFAKEKGIQKKKKEKLVWDDVAKEWKPRYGFKRINSERDDWLIEVPDNNTDPNVDLFAKKVEEKKERIAKNELQRLRNIARAQKLKIPGTGGVLPKLSDTKEELAKVVSLAKSSTASLGKFEETMKDEKPVKRTKKRKYGDNFGDVKAETEKSLEILDHIQNKNPKIDIDKAVNSLISTEEKE
ncbi:ribosome biogenesis regulatory protein-like protein [Dinothrombium tinctorium]|uniref:Ribosome biogenesis regulatory protein n=1 Tax=Dinothrombium tinctorium TaxID=1965070 RepID=A0A3S3S530_9ACAR|nr:ribosome biogenesis regulatory protein-like protein [Dinothrombium tinctorium]RWS17481.1 ribosome biogenesis regulatory protein-like protein [Dinothrombium tinctorium]RWS17485.1 ribosome biogenesis regulatory protein-like protein [Dinothrombium tinctorium]